MIVYFYFCLISTVVVCDQYRYDYSYFERAGGWFKVHVYPERWDNARIRCSLEGAVLASPINADLLSVMTELSLKPDVVYREIYTGVNARYSRGDFYSIEGFPLLRMPVPWLMRDPRDAKNDNFDEDCIVLTNNGFVATSSCSVALPYICYREGPRNVTWNECGTSDSGYEYFAYTGSCYKFHTVARNWSSAFSACSAEGGYLAIPNDNEEADHLRNLFVKNLDKAAKATKYKDVMLLGFSDMDHNAVWTTIHGSPLDENYAEWDKNQPEDGNHNDICGGMFQNGKLDDIGCKKLAPFACEKHPKSLMVKEWVPLYNTLYKRELVLDRY